VKGYRLIDLSSDLLIIERSVQFKESVSHAPQQPHGDTFILPPVRDDEHAHANSSSDESSDSEESDDSYSESVQSDVESEHPDAVAELEQRPKWAQTTLQDAGDLVGDPANIRRTRSDFKEPPIALTTTEPLPSQAYFLGSVFISTVLWRGCWKPLLGIRHAGGVQLPLREPDLGSGSPSFWEETCQMQMGLQDQERSGWTD
jgi:hypothetical protein